MAKRFLETRDELQLPAIRTSQPQELAAKTNMVSEVSIQVFSIMYS